MKALLHLSIDTEVLKAVREKHPKMNISSHLEKSLRRLISEEKEGRIKIRT